MKMSEPRKRAYFSQSPDIFARRLRFDDEAILFSQDVHPTQTLGSPVTREFLTYWQSLAAEAGGVPERRQFNPAMAHRILPFLSLVEQTEAGYRIRLTGTETDRVVGFVASGKLIRDLAPEFALKWEPVYHQALQSRQPFMFRCPSNCFDVSRLEMEAVSVPFQSSAAPSGDSPPAAAPSIVMTAFDICVLDSQP